MAMEPLFLLLLLLLLSTAAQPSLAQPMSESDNSTASTPPHHSRTAAGGFTPTTAIVLVVLISAFVVLTLFSIYINRCAPSRGAPPRRPPSRYSHSHPDHHQTGGTVVNPERRSRTGLDREVVESFPTAVYGDVKARVAAAAEAKSSGPPLECAVCLAAFEDHDDLRVLPACFHVFHPDCIDPWLAAATTCPLCRADLTAPSPLSTSSSDDDDLLTAAHHHQGPPEQDDGGGGDDERDEARLVAGAFTPEPDATSSFGGAARPEHEFVQYYRRTQSATADVPDRHTLRLPEHVMKELAAVRRHRRAASLAGYPHPPNGGGGGGAERTTPPGWLASFWRSVSWQRPAARTAEHPDAAAVVDEHGGGTGSNSNSKRVVPVTGGATAERPSGSGDADTTTDGKEKPDQQHDALNQV